MLDRSFDDRGRPVCEARRMNPAAFGQAPGACALTTQGSFGADRITKNSYDAASQLTKVTEGFGTAEQRDQKRLSYTPTASSRP